MCHKFSVAVLCIMMVACDRQQPAASSDPTFVVKAIATELEGYQIIESDDGAFISLLNSTGSASFTFDHPTGHYDIDVLYNAESAGQNTYTLTIGDDQIVAWLGKPLDDQWHRLSDQKWHAPRNIEIKHGDRIRIDGLSKNSSRATWQQIEFTPTEKSATRSATTASRQPPGETAPEILASPEDYFTVHPKEYPRAFKNPLMGFRGGARGHEYGTLTKTYIKWNEIENHADDGVDKIIEASNKRWKGFEENNLKAIPRVYLDWPNRDGGWPADMPHKDYSSEEFKERAIALIQKMGEAWDNDPRVAFIEMGLIGHWGEQEFPDAPEDTKKAIAAQFAESFPNKLVMVRWPNSYDDHIHNFGYYWDSFGHYDQEYYTYHLRKTAPRWQTAVIGGEVAYDWGNFKIQPGQNPNESLKNPVHRDFIINHIRALHTNHLGWIASYDHNDDEVRAAAEIMQLAFGYRFVVPEVSYPKMIHQDREFILSFKVTNTGSTPLYYNWPVEVSLLDPSTREVVWKQTCRDIDVRNWLPGEQWDTQTGAYKIPPQTYTINQRMKISDVPAGEYVIALAILDPGGNLPAARFAMENYFKGGRHPIGRVGIDHAIQDHEISGFDDLRSDNSLRYHVIAD